MDSSKFQHLSDRSAYLSTKKKLDNGLSNEKQKKILEKCDVVDTKIDEDIPDADRNDYISYE